MLHQTMHIKKIIINFFSMYGIKYTDDYLDQLLIRHPAQLSLWGIKDIFQRYGIECECVQFNDRLRISNEETPFIIIGRNDIFIIKSIENGVVNATSSDGKNEKIPLPLFLDDWDGNALIIDIEQISGEPNYIYHNKQRIISNTRRIIIGCSMILTISALIIFLKSLTASTFFLELIITNLLGTCISTALLFKGHHISHSIFDFLCGTNGSNIDCNRVTYSNGGKIFNLYDMSELSFTFFTTNLLVLLITPNLLSELTVFICISMVFTIWSIYYQAFKLKTWCTLCISVSLLIWIMMLIVLSFHSLDKINITYCLILGSSYIVGLEIVSKLGAAYDSHQMLINVKNEFKHLKYSNFVFEHVIKNSPRWRTNAIIDCGLSFGNQNAKTTIVIISNPICNPCAQMHKRLSDIKNSNIRFQYIFANLSDKITNINRCFICSYYKYGEDYTWNLLDKWFNKDVKDISFFDDLDLGIQTEDVLKNSEKMTDWLNKQPFVGTPTVLINGIEVVWPYSLEDYTDYN